MGCYVWYSEEGTGLGLSPPRHLFAVPNVTAHPSTASVSITVLLYNGPLLCGFNVPIKWYRTLEIYKAFAFLLTYIKPAGDTRRLKVSSRRCTCSFMASLSEQEVISHVTESQT